MSAFGNMSGGKLAVVVTTGAIVLGGAGYWLFGPTDVERNLTSGDAGRVVNALAVIDKDALGADGNDKLRTDAFNALKQAPLSEVFDRIRSPELSEEERARLESNLQQLMMEDMNRKVSAYFAAPEDQQQALMDAHIDEMQKFMGEMRAYREKHKDDPQYQADEEKRREARKTPTTQERKQQMESRNPDQMVHMIRYYGKMQSRAKERGIDFGRGMHGGGPQGGKGK